MVWPLFILAIGEAECTELSVCFCGCTIIESLLGMVAGNGVNEGLLSVMLLKDGKSRAVGFSKLSLEGFAGTAAVAVVVCVTTEGVTAGGVIGVGVAATVFVAVTDLVTLTGEEAEAIKVGAAGAGAGAGATGGVKVCVVTVLVITGAIGVIDGGVVVDVTVCAGAATGVIGVDFAASGSEEGGLSVTEIKGFGGIVSEEEVSLEEAINFGPLPVCVFVVTVFCTIFCGGSGACVEADADSSIVKSGAPGVAILLLSAGFFVAGLFCVNEGGGGM